MRWTNQGLSSTSECHGSSSDRSATLAGLFARKSFASFTDSGSFVVVVERVASHCASALDFYAADSYSLSSSGRIPAPSAWLILRACVRVAQSEPGHPAVQKSTPKRRHKVHPGLQIARGPLRSSRRI